jgi:hypothetical protein
MKRLVLEPLGFAQNASDVRPFPPRLSWLDPIFRSALSIEAAVLRRTRLKFPYGLSVICVARKPVEDFSDARTP